MNQLYSFPPKTILVPTDMGTASASALKYARLFHERFGSIEESNAFLRVHFPTSLKSDIDQNAIMPAERETS